MMTSARITGPATVLSVLVGAAGVPWALARWLPPPAPYTYDGIGVAMLAAMVSAVLVVAPILLARAHNQVYRHLVLALAGLIVGIAALWAFDRMAIFIHLELWVGVWCSAFVVWVVTIISVATRVRGEAG